MILWELDNMAKTLEEFGKTIKVAHPEYSDIPDAELGRKILMKYPQYQDMVSEKPSLEKPILQRTAEFPGQVGMGAIKGVLSTLTTVPTSIAKVVQGITESLPDFKNAAEARGRLAEVNTRLIQEANKFSEKDPKRKELLDLVQKTTTQLESLQTEEESISQQLGKLSEKPEFLKPKGIGEKIGFGAEKVGEFMLPSGKIRQGEMALAELLGKSGFPKIIQKGLAITGGAGMEAISAGGVTAAEGGKLDDIKNASLWAGILGIPFKTVSAVKGEIAGALQAGAEKKAAQALAPTTKEMKRITEKVVPEMLRRRVVFLGKGGLEAKAERMAEQAGEVLGDAYEALPPKTKIAITPIIQGLEDAKSSLVVEGTNKIPLAVQGQYQALKNIQKEIIELAGGKRTGKIGIESLRNYRQILDGVIARAKKGFGLTGDETAKLEATKTAANAIRNELAKEFPDIAKLNAEFNFWKNIEKVIGATIERTKPQQIPISQTIAESAGAVIGGVAGMGLGGPLSALGGIIATGLGFRLVKKALTSSTWRMFSAVQRSRIADLLMSGNTQAIIDALQKMIVAGISLKEQRE